MLRERKQPLEVNAQITENAGGYSGFNFRSLGEVDEPSLSE
jgi:hypothetical protein